MKQKFILDMTKGNEVALLLRFAFPMLVGNIFQQLYNMVDSVVVGRYVGANALASVGSVGNLNFLFFSLCFGLTSGIGILISQYFGAGKQEQVKQIIANSIYIILTAGIVISLISVIFARPILILMNTPESILDDAVLYMQIVCGATIVVAIYNGISAILRALGDSKTPLIFLVVASILNVILDLWFVIEFEMGVAGVAWATIISQTVSAIGSIIFSVWRNPYMKLEKQHFMIDWSIIKKSAQIGLPVAAQNAMIAFSGVALQSVVNRFGATVVAAYTATSRVEQFVHQPFGSLNMALSTFAGQNLGAGQHERVKRGCKKGCIMVVIFSILMINVMHLFANPIVGLFVESAEVIAIGAKGLQITSWFYIALGLIYAVGGTLNGAGDANYVMANGLIEVISRIILANLLVLLPVLGVWSVWYANSLTWIIAAILAVARFIQAKWKYKSVVS